jgi:hypothetical protein
MPNSSMKVNSSNIDIVHYDNHHSLLSITFHDGSVYNYANVSPEKYRALMNAPSKGRYLHQQIKGKHPVSKLR